MIKSRIAILLIAMHMGLIVTAGCGSKSPGGLQIASIQIGSKTYELEVAADDASREHGLMERDAMDSNHGMFFVFDRPEEQHFWMHHTRFPLDIIFADQQQKVISISRMKAYDENTTDSNGPAQYAIELNAGETTADGVKVGDKLSLPNSVLKSEKNR